MEVSSLTSRPSDGDGLGGGLAVELLDLEPEPLALAASEVSVADLLVEGVDGVEQRLGAGGQPGAYTSTGTI